jgi:hypothetical protein
MRKFRKGLRYAPETDEEAYLERQVALVMVGLAIVFVVAAVMVVASTFRGWRP